MTRQYLIERLNEIVMTAEDLETIELDIQELFNQLRRDGTTFAK